MPKKPPIMILIDHEVSITFYNTCGVHDLLGEVKPKYLSTISINFFTIVAY